MPAFRISTEVPLPPATFWQGMTLAEANQELWPWARMAAPQDWQEKPLAAWPTKHLAFTCWVYILGFIPMDKHSAHFEHIEADQGFSEHSHSLINRTWRHKRTTTPTTKGSLVTDEIHYHSRIKGLDFLLWPVYFLLFQYRHKRMAYRANKQARQKKT
jgi:hypothetical protein